MVHTLTELDAACERARSAAKALERYVHSIPDRPYTDEESDRLLGLAQVHRRAVETIKEIARNL